MLMHEAKKLHALLIVKGLQTHDHPLLRKLFSFLVPPSISNPPSPGFLCYVRTIFDNIRTPSTFIFNTIIRAYASSFNPIPSILLYNRMQMLSIPPDSYTFPFLLKACSTLPCLPKGIETHGRLVKHGYAHNIFIQNSLIHFYSSIADPQSARQVFDHMTDRDVASWTALVSCYARSGSVESARQLFDDMPARNVVSFSAMIAAYVHRDLHKDALDLFFDFQTLRLEANDSMFMSVICAIASLGALDLAKWIHCYMLRVKEAGFDGRICTAMIDMYCKCGSVRDALFMFEQANNKQVGEWTAMINGLAIHGSGKISIELFERMVMIGICPNAVTFVALLSACTHAGLVQEGLRYFKLMKSEYGIQPTIEHYGCVIDLLSRAGLIDEAVDFMGKMPMKATAPIWGALLTASRIHRNVGLGEIAARWLIREEPWNGAVYMTLLNLYIEAGRWDDVEKMKKEMKDVGTRKSPGCSRIEVNGASYEFVVGDKLQPQAVEVCFNLGELVAQENEKTWTIS